MVQEFKDILEDKFEQTSYHFGHPYLNTATLAGVLRMSVKELAKRYQTELTSN